ncbi:hypothetical protein UFOVP707_78 [uncultured Caudovirales phage]|uniref:Uncharacterized protein n=1 Tax=uncultured Caudovirales phage TaxID=2100421 RepID=A0A6J5NPM6_9CAUD|nr:hypothetical protein UFOVP707_78 [uncultured Caudovirales phage]
MTPEDIELLRLARSAQMGLVFSTEDVQAAVQFHAEGHEIGWNALQDDGDALRLAVALGMNVHVIRDDGTFVSRYEHEPVIAEKRGADPYAATRRAIVRVAAAIGKDMT